ncbi:hypothetical protein ACHHYP_14445 [Achlya hypogyna]|uniref:Uncharacterized protein n=1 Tax=Achlya hypogyna TaxID=1202772 RepID=A0A1V9ZF69_ACHHY|nr:hypothetical protein ACHHYP_14445 [Achlya hypogyna]
MATVSAMAATADEKLSNMMASREDDSSIGNGSGPTSPRPTSPRAPRTPTDLITSRGARARTRSSSLSLKSGGEDEDEVSEMGTPSKTRSHTMGTAESMGLRRNVKVVVQRTADVEQRLPQMVDKIGTIVETPRHPNTWFRVRFDHGKVLTFRASGLRPLREAQADGLHLDEELDGDDDEESVHDDDGDADADDEMHESFTKDTKVTVKLDDAAKRNKELKPLNGSVCTIVEVLANGGYKVQADHDVSITRVVKRKLLRHLDDDVNLTDDDAKKSATTNDEADSDNDEYDPSKNVPELRRKPKKKDQGTFLSDIDTEMWIGRRVRINVGKYSGMAAAVLKSGNGWVQLQVEDPLAPKTAKRAYELTLLDGSEGVDAPSSPPTASLTSPHKAETDETESDVAAAAEDSTVDSQDDERKGGALSRRRGHYGVSWIERKVLLPSNGGSGVVKKADRETCTVEVDNISKTLKVFRKQDLVLLEEDVGQRSRRANNHHGRQAKGIALPEGAVLMGITSTRYAMFQDQVKKHVMRRRDKIKHRPNLREWQAMLDLQYIHPTDIHDELSPTIDLFLIPSCTLCGVEKSELDGSCWNKACPRCPVWDPHVTPTLAYSRLPRVPLIDPRVNRSLHPDAMEHVTVLGQPKEAPAEDVSAKRKRDDDVVIKAEPSPPQDKPLKKKALVPPKTTSSPLLEPMAAKPAIVPTTTALPTTAAPAPPASFRPQYESVFAKKG